MVFGVGFMVSSPDCGLLDRPVNNPVAIELGIRIPEIEPQMTQVNVELKTKA